MRREKTVFLQKGGTSLHVTVEFWEKGTGTTASLLKRIALSSGGRVSEKRKRE